MSQFDFGTIDPSTKTGTVLASDLNAFRTALNSCHSGSSRPSYAIAKTIWVNDAVNPWVVYMFDGTEDIQIGTVDTTTNVFSVLNGAADKATPADADNFLITDSAASNATKKLTWANLKASIASTAGFAYSLGVNGYVKFPSWLGGWIIQWGNLTSFTANTTVIKTRPFAFPGGLFIDVLCSAGGSGAAISSNGSTATQISVRVEAVAPSAVFFISLGY